MRARSGLVLLVLLLATAIGAVPVARAQAATTTWTGALADGATWQIRVPADWNGTLLLYSHGYRAPGSPNPAQDVSDPVTGGWLLDHGFALAGSSYASTGWAIKEALADQAAVLDTFEATVGQAPDYPLQLMLGIYEFPGETDSGRPAGEYPKAFVVDYVRGYRLTD